jgi:predicted RNA-binding protein YlxR (DUF448 family)
VATPERTCIGCGAKKTKVELIRLVLSSQGQLQIDRDGASQGRGAYLCGPGCLKAALKRKAFARAFRGKAQVEAGEFEAALLALDREKR